MNLPMADWMQKHQVTDAVAAAARSPNDVMGIPSRRFRDLLDADRALTILLIPKIEEFPVSLQLLRHLYFETMLKVLLPVGIIGIGFSTHFGVSLNWSSGEIVQPHSLGFRLLFWDSSAEYPVPVALGVKVLLSYPAAGFARMPSSCPAPQYLKDEMVHRTEGPLASRVPMVVRPSPQNRVELNYQFTGCRLPVPLDDASYLIE